MQWQHRFNEQQSDQLVAQIQIDDKPATAIMPPD